MNVAIIIWQLDTYGGSIRQALELGRRLQASGHTADIFTYRVDREKCFPEFINEVQIYTPPTISLRQKLYNPGSPLWQRIVYFLYNDWVQRAQMKALAQLVKKMHAQKKYQVINYHDNGIIQIAKNFPDVLNVWMMNDPPSFIDTYEKQASVYANSLLIRLLAFFQKFQTQVLLRHIDKILVLDERNKRIVKEYFRRRALRVLSGIDVPKSLTQRVTKPANNKLKILTTNIFFRHRRYQDLIEAAAILINQKKLTQIEFRIIGDPAADQAYFEEIKQLAKSHGILSYFSFLGRVSEKVLEKEYRGAHIFVFPNHNQTWGLSVFEAMLRNCAVIVSQTTGAHDVLDDGKNAVFIKPKSPQHLADKLEFLIKNTRQREVIARRGHEFVLKNISWQKYADQLLKIFSRRKKA